MKRNNGEKGWLWLIISAFAIPVAVSWLTGCINNNFKKEDRKDRYDQQKDYDQFKADLREKEAERKKSEREETQRQAEENPEAQLEQKDKDVKAYVFKVLRLYQPDPPKGERVCADETDGK